MENKLTDANYYEDKEYLSSSMLKDFVKCPHYFRDKHILKIVEDEDKDAFIFGGALDCMLTEPEKFDDLYEVVARRSKDSDKRQLTQGQYEEVKDCFNTLTAQPLYKLFNQNKKGFQSIFWAEIDGVKRKGRLDYVDLEHRIINDIKTTYNIFDFDVKKWGYDQSMANYRELVAKVTNTDPSEWSVYLSVVDKNKDVKRCKFYLLDNSMLNVAEMKNKRYFAALDLAIKSGNFEHEDQELNDKHFQCFTYDKCPLFLQREFTKIF